MQRLVEAPGVAAGPVPLALAVAARVWDSAVIVGPAVLVVAGDGSGGVRLQAKVRRARTAQAMNRWERAATTVARTLA